MADQPLRRETGGPDAGSGSGLRGGLTIEGLVEAYHADAYRYGFRLTGNVADAEDLTQQTFLIAQQRIDQIRDPERARGWLLTVLRNCFLKRLQGKERRAIVHDVEIDELASVEPEESPLDSERLQMALDELSDEFRLVVLMFYFEDRSYKEIAEELGIAPGTVMSRLSRAKSQLRQWLHEREHRKQPIAVGGPGR